MLLFSSPTSAPAATAGRLRVNFYIIRVFSVFVAAQGVMTDPLVLLGDGQSYEGAAIRTWLRTHTVSPVTGQPLKTRDLVQNHALRNMIQAAQP